MYTCRLALVADRSTFAASSAVAGDRSAARVCSPRPVCDGILPEGCSRSVCDGILPEGCSRSVGAGEGLRLLGVGFLSRAPETSFNRQSRQMGPRFDRQA